MKMTKLFSIGLAVGLLATLSAKAQTNEQGNSALHEKLQALVLQVQTKAKDGKTSEADLADELKTLDGLIADEKGAKSDEAAQLVFMKAQLYLEVINNTDKGVTIIKQIKTDYPDTFYGTNVDKILDGIAKQAAAKKVQEGLAVGAVFPDFSVKGLDGKDLSVGALKGKVVLVDFWATWCPPCRAELPNVIATYNKHHGEGFEIIGVSLDSERDKLDEFLKKQDGMTWPQYFDGKAWSNELAVKYGVEGIPFAILVGPDGKIIGKELRGEELEAAVAKAVATK
jgi:thiol-disulfide isomerase/thioredoxin